ncbi:MAG: pknB [Microbacteriaceae bacterium]|jgi:beta-lactam-binding protein with PASTA domain/tRNA A-37 threonylcarbamoyl transferase component Bud32|nr:pknB [Microbacteriaceae bacterium]
MIGRLIDGRYQVRSRIARGGMATVYLATDLRLERRVAIKVMHGHLADDSQYKARFIQEARSAARLAHPNVVNVYDQGQDSETAYLVMEYLPGITLRDLLEEHHVLTTDQAFDIMEAVLSGLAAAHKNGIVHRDLKPENVLLADDGRIKIGDFGLARAATANTATGNALLGTIAYLSPELVTRGIADTRSDIYAVGIMLYEMLAGEQPFKGEQPFQIAHQHANDTVGTPSSKNPDVPAELDELVLWATARDPDQRPRDARTMLEQLLETQASLRSGARSSPTQRTMVLPAAVPIDRSSDATQVINRQIRQRTGPVIADSTAALQAATARRKSRGFWLFALVLLLAAAAGGTGWYFNAGPGALVSVPAVSGQSVEQATATLTAANLVVAAGSTLVYDPVVESGFVVGTDPDRGAAMAQGEAVTLLVSQGPEPLPVPQLAGLAREEATSTIENARFTAAEPTEEFNADVPEGTVIRAIGEDGAELAAGATYLDQRPITLVLSRGAVPNVSGMSVEEATSTLEGVGLLAERGVLDYSDTISKDNVITAAPRSDGAVVPGHTLDLTISLGPRPVPVPDVVGQSWADAKQALLNLGFQLSYNITADIAPGAFIVTETNPGAGTAVAKGSTIRVGLTF